MYELALFAGAGGGLLATRWFLGWRTVCYVEFAAYPVSVLQARIRDRYLDDAPIWDDANAFDGRPWAGCVDIITAGFPCQPFSLAGQQRADGDQRNGWPATIRIIREVRPPFVLLENVAGLLSAVGSDGRRYFGRILGDLAESGYSARWRVLSAAEVGAPHKRDRVFILGYLADSNGDGKQQPSRSVGEFRPGSGHGGQALADADGGRRAESGEFRARGWEPDTRRRGEVVANPDGERFQGAESEPWDAQCERAFSGDCGDVPHANDSRRRAQRSSGCSVEWERGLCTGREEVAGRVGNSGTTVPDSDDEGQPADQSGQYGARGGAHFGPVRWWDAEPGLGRVAHGVAHRVDRLRAIGGGQVPAVVAAVWDLLRGG